MSPGPTFDRVYAALKAQLLEGSWRPGARLEPGAIGDDLAASVTPVRDALHRLVGEGLVEAPRHDGFWVPVLTEVQLRGLYKWNGDLLAWALRRQRGPRSPAVAAGDHVDPEGLFGAIARASGNTELERAVARSNDRLAPFRAIEGAVLTDIASELTEISDLHRKGDTSRLRRRIAAYHRRRARATPLILEARRRSAGEDPSR